MLEESISCSPGNNKKKLRSRRFHKNAKKKCEQHTETPTADNVLPKEYSSLDALYEESTNSGITNRTTNFEYFNPFENEKLLAAADRAEASSSSSNLHNLTSNGFVRLENLPFKEETKTFPMKPPERPPQCHPAITPRSPHVLGPETQFGITESEFVRFCDDAESDVLAQSITDGQNQIIEDFNGSTNMKGDVEAKKMSKAKSIVEEILTDFCGSPTESEIEEQTPNSPAKNLKGAKSIVDEILEDFCGSPYTDSPPKGNSDDSTPIFRFKSQPIRTYSRLRRKKLVPRNIATDLNEFTLKNDGNTSDSSSGLSVQEDFSQSIVPQLDTVDLNNSVKLCENLLNLSSYFSQLTSSSSKEKSPPPVVDETKDLRLSAIVEEILQIKSKPLRIDWNIIDEEFMGFSDYESDSKESTLQELLEVEDDILEQINCDSLCYEKIEPKVSFINNDDRDMENTLRNASAVIERARALMLSGSDLDQKSENSKNKYQPDSDIQNKPLPNSPFKDEQLFEDIDIWNDNDCLLNYKTQKPHSKHVEHKGYNLFNDDLNQNETVNKSKKSEAKNSIIQKSKPDTKAELDTLSSCNNWQQSFKDNQRFQNSRDPCSSVSLKHSVTSRRTENFKSNRGNEYKQNEEEKIIAKNVPETSTNFFMKKDVTNESLQENTFLNKVPSSNFVGFATVSNKPILISDIARQRANDFLKKFEQQELDERLALDKNEISKDIRTNNADCNLSKTPVRENQGVTTLSPTSSHIHQSKNALSSGLLDLNLKEGVIMKKNENEKQEQMVAEFGVKENQDKIQAQCDNSSGDARPNNTINNNCFAGFSTASKKLISISNKSKLKADEFLKKFEHDEQEKRMLEIPFVGNKKNEDNVSEKNLKVCGFVGFSTASEKPIAISLEAKRKADQMLKKFEQAEKIEKDKNDMAEEKLTQRHPNEISEEVRRKAQELLLDIEFFEEAFEDELKEIEAVPVSQMQVKNRTAQVIEISAPSAKVLTQASNVQIFEGFKTASRKAIHVSEEASRRAETFLKAVYDKDLPQEFLKCIENDINDTDVNGKNAVGNLMDKVEQVDGAIKSPSSYLHDVLKTELEHMHATNDLKMNNEYAFHGSEDRMVDNRITDPALGRIGEQKEPCCKDTHLHSREYDTIVNMKCRKRKHSEGHELEKSSSLVTPRRVSWGERTPLNRIENGLLSKSSSLPLKESTSNSTLISRKNLLSLSKRKKLNSPGQIVETKSGPKTPEKEQHSSIAHCNPSSTPNLKEFFDSVSTSTPRLIRNNDPTNQLNQNPIKETTIDPDFRQIQWEDSNNSFRINRTGCVDDVNVTFSQVSPSPKQRIERLKMYGEPPPISPILMLNKCRTSGLRRGRSLMKP